MSPSRRPRCRDSVRSDARTVFSCPFAHRGGGALCSPGLVSLRLESAFWPTGLEDKPRHRWDAGLMSLRSVAPNASAFRRLSFLSQSHQDAKVRDGALAWLPGGERAVRLPAQGLATLRGLDLRSSSRPLLERWPIRRRPERGRCSSNMLRAFVALCENIPIRNSGGTRLRPVRGGKLPPDAASGRGRHGGHPSAAAFCDWRWSRSFSLTEPRRRKGRRRSLGLAARRRGRRRLPAQGVAHPAGLGSDFSSRPLLERWPKAQA
jgi:hypothetical protein